MANGRCKSLSAGGDAADGTCAGRRRSELLLDPVQNWWPDLTDPVRDAFIDLLLALNSVMLAESVLLWKEEADIGPRRSIVLGMHYYPEHMANLTLVRKLAEAIDKLGIQNVTDDLVETASRQVVEQYGEPPGTPRHNNGAAVTLLNQSAAALATA